MNETIQEIIAMVIAGAALAALLVVVFVTIV